MSIFVTTHNIVNLEIRENFAGTDTVAILATRDAYGSCTSLFLDRKWFDRLLDACEAHRMRLDSPAIVLDETPTQEPSV